MIIRRPRARNFRINKRGDEPLVESRARRHVVRLGLNFLRNSQSTTPQKGRAENYEVGSLLATLLNVAEVRVPTV